MGRAGPGPGVVAGLQRAHFLPMLLEGAVIWPSLPQPGLLTQQPQGGGETGFLDKKNPSPGHPWPRFLLRRWEVEPWVLSGFPAGGWGGGWGWSRLWALGSRAVPLPAQPDCPSLGTTLCGSPVPAGCGSRCRLALLSCDSRPGSLGPQEPRLPRPPGPAYLSAQSGVCMCASSSRKPPWVRSPPFTAVVPASHPLEEETGQASEPPQHQCWPGSQTATPGALGQAEGQGLVFTEPVGFGCLNGRALCLVECSGAPLPGKWEWVAPAATVSVQSQGLGQRLLACRGAQPLPLGCLRAGVCTTGVCAREGPRLQIGASCLLGRQRWGHLLGSGPFLPRPGARMDAALWGVGS